MKKKGNKGSKENLKCLILIITTIGKDPQASKLENSQEYLVKIFNLRPESNEYVIKYKTIVENTWHI